MIFLPQAARFEHLLNLPEGANVGLAINDAMAEIEKHNPQLAGVLPRTFQIFTSTLLKELLKKVSEIPVSLDYDAFGRAYRVACDGRQLLDATGVVHHDCHGERWRSGDAASRCLGRPGIG